ncbi:tudor domain-containing 6 [Oncorhynchus tshawytscha]|uniref:Tudor domain-containing protein n=1 Tax=Oncorhynchus tshawytscha TaxID=74940 RepID=A0A8C8GQY3_ONCTS|nr:tudor domain-containing 6 [Oncorhynchus tshawytscha]
MCSIPGLPIPGSQVTVLITRVNLNPICSLVELWGNFDQERQHAYQQMRRVQIPRQRFCESEGNPGDLCLAHLNGTWHRARIISRHGHHYNVFLIDEGRAHVATNNTLAWGQNDCFLLPPEVEFCVLANVSPLSHENKWTPTASDFLDSLCGKTVNGMVQDVLMPDRTVLLYIPIINKHMYEVGFARKLPSDKFKQLVLSSLNFPKSQVSSTETLPPTVSHKRTDAGREIEKFQQFFYPELLTDFIETVEVTEVINPQRIFCKLSIFSQELKKLSEQINEYYEGRSTFCKARQTASGAPCAARGSNGKWYRSLLQQDIGSESAVEVLLVDNGKTDFVHVGDIRPLAAKFFRMPVVTYVCSLHGIEDRGIGWTVDEIKYLKSVLLHKTVIAKFEYHNLSEGINCVTLYGDDNVNINNLFGVKERCLLESERPPPRVTEKSFATDIQNSVHPLTTPHFPSATETVLNEHWFQVGITMEVKVSCIESPAKFWCQMAQESTSLQILMQEMQYHYTSSPPQQIDGDICVALDHDNGMWYRARIVENDRSPHVDVRFIDYGQTRRVSLQDLRPLDPVFRRLKTQAFQCFLQNLNTPTSPVPAEWSDAASSEFQKFVDSTADSNVGLKCTVHAVMRDTQGLVINMVDIETPVQSACKLLVQKGVKAPAPLKSPPLSSAPPDTKNFSLHNIEVGGKEKVWITSAKSVAHFYGQLERNSHVNDKLTKDLQHFCHQPLQSTNCPQSLETVCFAKYTDNQWYRGQIKATHPTLEVHFVDYGDTVTLSQSDILPCPVEAVSLMSVPVQAVPFGLFGIPEDVSQEVNRWFEKHATDLRFTITAVAKDSGGKLLVELYDGTTHINEMVREKLKEVRPGKEIILVQSPSLSSKLSTTSRCADQFQTKLNLPEYVQMPTSQDWAARGTVIKHSSTAMCFTSPQRRVGQSTPQQSLLDQPEKKPMVEHDGQMCRFSKLTDLPSRHLKPGLVTEVYVSHCNSHSSFFIQLTKDEDDIFSLVEKLNGSQSSCDATPVDLNELQLGDLVNAEYPEDSSWYRAVVRRKPGNGTVHVEFIDFGNEAIIPSLKVKQLDKQFIEYPRFSIHCVLGRITNANNKETWEEDVTSMIKKATTTENAEKKLACAFMKETGSVWEVSLEDQGIVLAHSLVEASQTGRADVSQLSCSGENTIPLLYKKPSVSQNQALDVYASSIVEPNYFWCQHANSEELYRISRIVQEFVNSALQDPVLMDTLNPRSPCLAFFAEDNQWYRAQIVHKTNDLFTVLFVDYGNESEVDLKAIRSIPPPLLESAPQAFLCSLAGVEHPEGAWDNNTVDEFYQLIVDKPLKVTVQKMYNDLESLPTQYQVKVECEEHVINDLMRSYLHCSDLHVHSKTECADELFSSDMTISNETLNRSEYKRLTQEITPKLNSTEAPVMDRSPSTTQCSGDTLAVRTISYNGLAGVSSSGSNVPSESVPKLETLPKRSIKPGWVSDVYVSQCNSPSSFFVQLVEDEKCLFSLVESLNSDQSDGVALKNVVNLQPGDLVNSEFPDDCSWYRAVILETNGEDKIHVQYIDFGNEAFISPLKVCRLDTQFLEHPRFSIHCSLSGLADTKYKGLEQEICCQFKKVAGADSARKWECKFIKDTGSTWEVCLDQNIILTDSLNMCCSAGDSTHLDRQSPSSGSLPSQIERIDREHNTQLQFWKLDIVLGQTLDVYASSIAGPGYFWCQYANSEELAEISKVCQLIGNSEHKDTVLMSTLSPGSLCLALFAEDKQWYRAQIVSKMDVISVVFVDYGNESETDLKSLKSVPPQLLEHPPQAFLCSLAEFENSEGSWDDNALDGFHELLADKPLKVTVQSMDNNIKLPIPQYQVKVECEELIVNDFMKTCWRGSPTESQSEEAANHCNCQREETDD